MINTHITQKTSRHQKTTIFHWAISALSTECETGRMWQWDLAWTEVAKFLPLYQECVFILFFRVGSAIASSILSMCLCTSMTTTSWSRCVHHCLLLLIQLLMKLQLSRQMIHVEGLWYLPNSTSRPSAIIWTTCLYYSGLKTINIRGTFLTRNLIVTIFLLNWT